MNRGTLNTLTFDPVAGSRSWIGSGLFRTWFSSSAHRVMMKLGKFVTSESEHPTMTLDDLERLVREAIDPRDIFGDDVAGNLERYLGVCRPDRNPGEERRAEAVADALKRFASFTPEDVRAIAGAEAVLRAIDEPVERPEAPEVVIRSPKRAYTLVRRLAVGDLADVHIARAKGFEYVLKIARVREAARHLENEKDALTTVLRTAGDSHYRKYFPTLAESFPVKDVFPKRVNVVVHDPRLYTLEEVHALHPSLDGRHLAWIFKRLLTAVGFVHRCGLIHGAVVPAHVLVEPEGHGLRLIGWGHSVRKGERILTGPARYDSWYPPEVRRKEPAVPATDIYLAARCVLHLAGGDPVSQRMPAHVPREIELFVRSCLLEGTRMRPSDAWAALDQFDELLRGLYGPPKYHRLVM
jgi:serine/threonine protein kinase